MLIERDAKVRHYYKTIEIDGLPIQSLGYQLAKHINTNANNPVKIKMRWRHSEGFKQVSYAEVYGAIVNNDHEFLTQFSGKLVLIGATGAGLFDGVATPINNSEAGVFVIANGIVNYLQGDHYNSISSIQVYSLSLLVMVFTSTLFLLKISLEW